MWRGDVVWAVAVILTAVNKSAVSLLATGVNAREEIRMVEFGESCSAKENKRRTQVRPGRWDDYKICNHEKNLKCIEGQCQCRSGYTLSVNATCLEISNKGLGSDCQENVQCWKSLLGRLSRCNQVTGKCECYHSETLPIVYHQGRCLYGEPLGEYCKMKGLCPATVENADCHLGTCQCKEGYVPSWDKSRCLPIATEGLNSSCVENVQCEQGVLGTLSECNQITMKCQCYSIPMVPTVFSQGRCYFGASLRDVCQVHEQCQVKNNNSECAGDGKCVCLPGYVASEDFSSCLPIASADGIPTEIQIERLPKESTSTRQCEEDTDCYSSFGDLYQCNKTTGTCHCSKRAIYRNGKCLERRTLGHSCSLDQQCEATTKFSKCLDNICTCDESRSVISQDGVKCLKIVEFRLDECDEDFQCQRGLLGVLSKCDLTSRKCICIPHFPVKLFKDRCLFTRQIGSVCRESNDCQVGIRGRVGCISGTCRCIGPSEALNPYYCGMLSASERISFHSTLTCFVLTLTVYINST